jgi:hypothetical protein
MCLREIFGSSSTTLWLIATETLDPRLKKTNRCLLKIAITKLASRLPEELPIL